MNAFCYRYTDKEIKELLSKLTILVDTREKENQHILQYFNDKGITYESMKLDTGDYSVMLPANPGLGIIRNLYFPVAIERKNSLNELVQTIKDRTRFENELIRSQKFRFLLMIEDPSGYENILRGNYQSKYDPKALMGSLKSFETRYGFTTVFIPKEVAGHYLYYEFYYFVRNYLKGFSSSLSRKGGLNDG
ncbi:ERCC4 domain-containing protein [Neobacillus niacini]|uniref:ERCC4 domain-containing protein n=1 Tax=Neobacillus niacini TaxID=86668 RepID=UPI001C8E6C7D|nr:ERCC4 domain-containing protein [Neobacillus niacini]MBY0144311.1 ERCC4 domain-containing protein [Neobacillus niacini]